MSSSSPDRSGDQSYEVVEEYEEVEVEEEVEEEEATDEAREGGDEEHEEQEEQHTATADAAAASKEEQHEAREAPEQTLTEAAPAQEPAPEATPPAVEVSSKAAEPEAETEAARAAPETTPAKATEAADGVGLDLQALEAQATKGAQEVLDAAKEVSTKIAAGLSSALLGTSATAGTSLTKLAGGLTNWWSSLDPPAQPKNNELVERVQASGKASSELQELLGLMPEENLVEAFNAKLLQTYACSHNNHTPAIQMAFQGTLYITDRHTCFVVEERGRKLPFKVPHTQVVKATRQRPQRKGDLSDVLRLDLQSSSGEPPQFLAFKDFEASSSLDSALALVEHLVEN